MSDEELDIQNNLEDDSEEILGQPKSNKIFTDKLAKFLTIIIIGVIALIVTITVSFLTYRFMDRGNRSRQFPVLSQEYTTTIPQYAIWTFLTDEGYDLRTQTSDVERYTVSAKIKFGYDSDKFRELQSELTSKNDLLMDSIRFYFSQRTRVELQDELAVKAELLNRVNSLLSQGEIEQVLFLQYQVIRL